MSTIPASDIVDVNPSVLPAGGSALVLNGMILTESTRVPIGTVMAFSSTTAVAAFFGANSNEAVVAGGGVNKGSGYFGGYDGSTLKPGTILFAQYPAAAVAAYLRGGNLAASLTLAQLQALSGSLTVVMDGYSHVISSISLATASSFSAAAAAIQAAFTDPTESSFTASLGSSFTGTQSGTNLTTTAVTCLISVGDVISGTGVAAGTTIVSQTSGTTGGAGVYVTSLSGTASTASCTSTSTVLNVTAESDTISIGQTLAGASVTGSPVILSQISGSTGGVGLYRISGAGLQIASEAMTGLATAPVVTFDSVSGAFVVTSGITGTPSTAGFATGTLAASLFLTSATGAALSQGAEATTPSEFMNGLVQVSTNWASFMTAFDPDGGSGNANKLAFAAWNDAQNDRYVYVAFDTDVTPAQSVPATGSLGYLLQQANYSGTVPIYEPSDLNLAAFVCGAIASIDFTRTNGRVTLAFRSQSGLVPSVSNQQAAHNLGGNPQVAGDFGNGYNFYGPYATANNGFTFFNRGSVSGPFKWINTYVQQIQLNASFQLALMTLLTSVGSVAFNTAGYAQIESVLNDPINAALNFGTIRTNVPLSATQIAAVNAAAGKAIDSVLATRGWYLSFPPASPTVRQSRGPLPGTFWYMDGEDVQSISLASIVLL
jgi:hypothetical protein